VAAGHLIGDLLCQLETCRCRLADLVSSLREQDRHKRLPTEGEIFHEILALQAEFDDVALEPGSGEIRVTVGPIVLEDIHLGCFQICLGGENGGFPPYRVVALEPNPAASNDDVTHPHVQDERLCEGEGRAAIRSALAQGRLLDFFLIVSRTLSTYARGSAYVELDRWYGESCSDCGGTVSEDERSYCYRCDQVLCADCEATCQGCSYGFCAACISTCHECHGDYCSSCLEPCSQCHQDTCTDCLHQGICRSCHDEREQERNDEDGSDDGAEALSGGRPDAETWFKAVLEGEPGSAVAVRSGAPV
jgi:hypothetical protein